MDGSALQCAEAARARERGGERGTCDAEPENATGLFASLTQLRGSLPRLNSCVF